MIMTHSRLVRLPLILLSGTAITLAATRCSPLAVSQSRGIHSGASGVSANPIKPIEAEQETDEAQTKALLGVQASVQDASGDYKSTLDSLSIRPRVTLSAESHADALEAFKISRSLTLDLDGISPDECKAIIGVSLRESVINEHGWNNEANAVKTDCVPLSDGNWKISVSESVSQDAWNQLAASMVSVTIVATENPEIKIVKTPETANGGTMIKPPIRR